MYQYAFVCALSLPFQKLQIVLMQEALEEPRDEVLNRRAKHSSLGPKC